MRGRHAILFAMVKKATTLNELGETLTYMVHNMATKADVAELRAEMHEKFAEVRGEIGEMKVSLKRIEAEISDIQKRLDRLEEQGASAAGYAKEIDYLRAEVRAIQKYLKLNHR